MTSRSPRLATTLLLAAVLLAEPAGAAVKVYELAGDQSSLYPIPGTLLRPGSVSGTARIDESGDGSPVLVELELRVAWTDGLPDLADFGCGIPGTTLFLDVDRTLTHEPTQVGTGSTTTSIAWGALSGWTQSGRTICETRCPGGCPPLCDECPLAVGFSGTGPPPPLNPDLDSDPWTFSGDGFAFDASPVEITTLGGGASTSTIVWQGRLGPALIPAMPFATLLGLGAALASLGATALRRRRAASSDPVSPPERSTRR